MAISILIGLVTLLAGLAAYGTHFGYREGWKHGYGSGYGDREDEIFHGEKPGTRRGRTKP
jgi:hypothetical protein